MDAQPPTADTDQVRRYYDESAKEYDGWLRYFDRVMLGDRRRALCALASGRTLEVAVGTGANLQHYGRGVTLTGVDLSAGMLAIARRRAAPLELSVELELGDAEHLAAPDATFDTVVATLLLSTVPDPRRAAIEMRRVLVPGGRLLVLDMARSPLRPVRWLQQAVEPLTTRSSRFSLMRDPLDYLGKVGFVIDRHERSRGGVIEQVVARKA
jgi:ubiquinone/menaquinone biosynthesis C-methylase UbiE